MSNFKHTSVLVKETLDGLNIRDHLTYIDATFGCGGISKKILEAANCKLVAIDKDPDVIKKAQEFSSIYKNRFTFILGNFGTLKENLKNKKLGLISGGIVADLGVSSIQLDNANRGFSFGKNGPLDMRMSKNGLTAKEVVNTLNEKELSKIFWQYGDERNSRKIAKHIVNNRKTKTISTTFDLVEIIKKINRKSKFQKIHPATKVFQSLRIYVNKELEELKNLIADSEKILMPGARLAIISFHSLEDKIVKQFFNKFSGKVPNSNRHSPQKENKNIIKFKKINKKVTVPKNSEVLINVRSRSGKLRILERIAI